MVKRLRFASRLLLFAGLLTTSIIVPAALTQTSKKPAKPATTPAPAATPKPPATPTPVAAPTRYQPSRFPRRAELHYSLVWGVDSLSVKAVESGEIIRFNYRVLDAQKAKALNDKKAEPSLIDPQAGVKLVVPSLEQVGQLRQSAPPDAGKIYWMAFSNSGRKVKRGDRVNVVIGQFQAQGLVVE